MSWAFKVHAVATMNKQYTYTSYTQFRANYKWWCVVGIIILRTIITALGVLWNHPNRLIKFREPQNIIIYIIYTYKQYIIYIHTQSVYYFGWKVLPPYAFDHIMAINCQCLLVHQPPLIHQSSPYIYFGQGSWRQKRPIAIKPGTPPIYFWQSPCVLRIPIGTAYNIIYHVEEVGWMFEYKTWPKCAFKSPFLH